MGITDIITIFVLSQSDYAGIRKLFSETRRLCNPFWLMLKLLKSSKFNSPWDSTKFGGGPMADHPGLRQWQPSVAISCAS